MVIKALQFSARFSYQVSYASVLPRPVDQIFHMVALCP